MAMSKTNTKKLFLETASALFAIKGYNATGISEILKQSGAPKGSLYYHFPQGKEQLADEALQMSAINIFGDIKESLARSNEPVEFFQAHLRAVADKIKQDMFEPNISISLMALETYSFSERLRLRCNDIFEEMQEIYKNKFIQSGTNEQSAKLLAMAIVALIEGTITLCLTQKNVQPMYDLADNLPKLFNFK